MITKQQKEAQIQHIFRLLVECKTQEEIARELNIGLKTVYRYSLEIDKRYGQIQAQKTDNTLFMECQLFKNRMLTLYKILENKATDLKTNGSEAAKCCEVAANIAIDVLKMESEGIRAVKELVGYGKGQSRLLQSIQSRYTHARDDGGEDDESGNTNNTEQ
ncbi:MAG: hypothetical protein K0S93_510, partial [Nitrososphaeraceae archaeon]|nr:hypothetical protein [Nitrososphaeraceae archaeon]